MSITNLDNPMKKLIRFTPLCAILGLGSVTLSCTVISEKPLPTEQQAEAFIKVAEINYWRASNNQELAWYNSNRFSNLDTQNQLANLSKQKTQIATDNVYQSAQFNGVKLSPDMAFRFTKIRSTLSNPAPEDSHKSARLAKLTSQLAEQYSTGIHCEDKDSDTACISLADINEIMIKSNDYSKLLQTWQDRGDTIKSMRVEFQEKIALNNIGAQRIGYQNLADMRSDRLYQMSASDTTKELDRVWQQISPLYESLQCHVRAELGDKYGTDVVPQSKPIPAHLIGDLAGGNWSALYPMVAPKDAVLDRGYNLQDKLKSAGYSELDIVRTADKFYSSMGFESLDDAFYNESVFKKTKENNTSCNSGYWWLYENKQARAIQCLNITDTDFYNTHGSMRFIPLESTAKTPVYHRYAPTGLLRSTPIRLSITPSYLKEIGLLDKLPAESSDLGFLMKLALDEIAPMPLYLVVDKWQTAVASGAISAKNYNQYWWQLRQQYEGIAPPTARGEEYFDPGAIEEIISNRDLSPYAVSSILKFQTHKILCEASESKEILSRCSIYNSKKAGAKLLELFEMGNSRTWSDTLAAWTNEQKMDGTGIVEYFAPLKKYLDKQNEGRSCGW